MLEKRIQVLVCPTPECDNYFGSTSMPTLILGQQNRGRGPNGETICEPYPRTNCPACRGRGKDVMRVLLDLTVEVPVVVDAAA